MNKKKRVIIQYYVKLGKAFAETHDLPIVSMEPWLFKNYYF